MFALNVIIWCWLLCCLFLLFARARLVVVVRPCPRPARPVVVVSCRVSSRVRLLVLLLLVCCGRVLIEYYNSWKEFAE